MENRAKIWAVLDPIAQQFGGGSSLPVIWEKGPYSCRICLHGPIWTQTPSATCYSVLPTSQPLSGDYSPAPCSEMSRGHLSQEELEGPMKYLLPPSGGSGLLELQNPPTPTSAHSI